MFVWFVVLGGWASNVVICEVYIVEAMLRLSINMLMSCGVIWELANASHIVYSLA